MNSEGKWLWIRVMDTVVVLMDNELDLYYNTYMYLYGTLVHFTLYSIIFNGSIHRV